MRVALGAVVVGVLASSASTAGAAPRKKKQPAPTAEAPNPARTTMPSTTPDRVDRPEREVTIHKEGDYGGVEPGRTPTTDHPRPARMPAKGTLSWIGFEAKDGGAQLFFQSPGPFEVTQYVDGGQLVVHLAGLSRLGANEWRAIDTRFFDNPLSRIEAKTVGAARATKVAPAHGAGIEIRITFKNAKDAREATYRAAQEADGYAYAYLAFPEGIDGKTVTEPTVKDPEQ